MPNLRIVLHVLSLFWLGIMAGFFWTYSVNVSQVMAQMDGATYAIVQSALNRGVRHAMFFVFFFGPPLWCALTLVADWRAYRKSWWWLLLVAAVVYTLGIIFFTSQVNLPNNVYTESWNPQQLPTDWEATRDNWRHANHWRVLSSAVAFLLAACSLACRPRP